MWEGMGMGGGVCFDTLILQPSLALCVETLAGRTHREGRKEWEREKEGGSGAVE